MTRLALTHSPKRDEEVARSNRSSHFLVARQAFLLGFCSGSVTSSAIPDGSPINRSWGTVLRMSTGYLPEVILRTLHIKLLVKDPIALGLPGFVDNFPIVAQKTT